jgi:DNA anti-recombination protein RmuC
MAGKQLRSRVVEFDSNMSENSDADLPSGQVESFEETTDDALVGEVQLSESSDNAVNAVVATDSQDSLREFIANMFASLQNGNTKLSKELSEKMENDNKEVSERMGKNNTKLRKELSEKFEGNNTKLSEKIERENEKLIQRFGRENEKLNKELTEKIAAETAKLYTSIKQVRNDTDREFSGMKSQFDKLMSKVND